MKKVISLIIVLVVAAGLLCPFAVSAAATEFKIQSESSSAVKGTSDLEEGGTLALQLALTTSVKSIGVTVNTAGAKKELRVSLYKWTNNVKESLNGNPIKTEVFSDWSRKALISLSFDGNGLDAGEYVFSLNLEKGEKVTFPWIRPTRGGVNTYLNGYLTPGSPTGIIETVAPADGVFGITSEPTGTPLATPPKESVIADDSPIALMNVDPSTWNGVDGLGRTYSTYTQVGSKQDKKVGIFYWTWHLEQSGGNPKAVNVQKILDEYPEARNDYNHQIWGSNNVNAYWWNEPLWGFYIESDDYVLRKHAELLADAGVDFVVFDCTNGSYTWESAYMNLCKVWSQARQDGIKTPQIAFMLNFGVQSSTVTSITSIYQHLYAKGLYQDLWFYYDGKPFIMANKDVLSDFDPLQEEIKNYFTFRYGQASYFAQDEHSGQGWGWLSTYPQTLYYNGNKVEMTTVGVAQNANYKTQSLSAMNGPYNMGRSYTAQENFSYSYKYKGQEIVVNKSIENSKFYGLNFQEQWDYAISKDPDVIFVTGWNEWIAGRNEQWGGVSNGFPDQCDDENSRDCEPSKGELKDYYYCQLVENIRRFKGAGIPQGQTAEKTININNDAGQWNDKKIVTYNHYTGNTPERNAKGWDNNVTYKGEAIRNDIKTAKVSYDKNNVYFYVETVNDITSHTDHNWMRLLLDTVSSEDADNGWEGFEYIVNRENSTDTTLTLEKFTGGWSFEKVADVKYTIQGNIMQIEIPRTALALSEGDFKFNFKWCDNNLEDGDFMTLYTEGDCAPGSRFTFAFSTKKTPTSGCNGSIGGGAVVLLSIGLFLSMKKTKKWE